MIKIRFKKFLICEMAQMTVEYFLLFTIIALFTVVGISKYLPEFKKSFENMQTKALARVSQNQDDSECSANETDGENMGDCRTQSEYNQCQASLKGKACSELDTYAHPYRHCNYCCCRAYLGQSKKDCKKATKKGY